MSRLNLDNQTYFVTSVTYRRRDLFSDPEIAQVVLNQWQHYQEPYDFDLRVYVIMPDHYHVLIKIEGDKNLSQILYAVHSYSAKRINENIDRKDRQRVWQRDTFDEAIRSKNMYYQKIAYILFNPWRAGLVESPFGDYEFSNLDELVNKKGVEFVEDLFSKYRRWAE